MFGAKLQNKQSKGVMILSGGKWSTGYRCVRKPQVMEVQYDNNTQSSRSDIVFKMLAETAALKSVSILLYKKGEVAISCMNK